MTTSWGYALELEGDVLKAVKRDFQGFRTAMKFTEKDLEVMLKMVREGMSAPVEMER
jgi:hypothetical protein